MQAKIGFQSVTPLISLCTERVSTEHFPRIIPESASWLVVKGRLEEAVLQYKLVARINNKEFKVEEDRIFSFYCVPNFDNITRRKR